MTQVNCEKCKSQLSLEHLFDILMDKIEKERHAFDVFKCNCCEHLTHIPVKQKTSIFK